MHGSSPTMDVDTVVIALDDNLLVVTVIVVVVMVVWLRCPTDMNTFVGRWSVVIAASMRCGGSTMNMDAVVVAGRR